MGEISSGNRRRNIRNPVIPYLVNSDSSEFVLAKNEIGIKIVEGEPKIIIGNGEDPVDILEEYYMIMSIATGKSDGSISINGTDIKVKGLKSAAFKDTNEIFDGSSNSIIDKNNVNRKIEFSVVDGILNVIYDDGEVQE